MGHIFISWNVHVFSDVNCDMEWCLENGEYGIFEIKDVVKIQIFVKICSTDAGKDSSPVAFFIICLTCTGQ